MKQKIYVRYQANNLQSFNDFTNAVKKYSFLNKIECSSIKLPVRFKRYTVLKSPHVNKTAKDQLEIRFYNGLIILTSINFGARNLYFVEEICKENVVVKLTFNFGLHI